MAKLKKYQQVELYLSKLLQRGDFGLKELEALNYRDICDAEELEGIGDRTVSNVLTAYKIKKGIQLPEKRTTKKQMVEDYLTRLLDSGRISQRELHQLSYNDLKDVQELAEVGKTTITCTLAEFKQNNDKDSFEMGVLDFLAQEKSGEKEENEAVEMTTSMVAQNSIHNDVTLDNDNIRLIKKMINEFKQLKSNDEERKLFELRELKHALHFVGINPSKIVRLYWEDISKDFMHRKILSGKSPVPTEMQVSSFM
ncbi:MAG: hypothetical protein MJE63_19395 [Proteobacteria bacterium]|nr:hypothetical protein [Pseudomonadota bacterium]